MAPVYSCRVLVRQAFLHRGLEAGPAWKRQHGHASSIVHPDFIFIQLVQSAVSSGMDFQGHRAPSVFRVIRYDRGLHPDWKGAGRKGKAQHHGFDPRTYGTTAKDREPQARRHVQGQTRGKDSGRWRGSRRRVFRGRIHAHRRTCRCQQNHRLEGLRRHDEPERHFPDASKQGWERHYALGNNQDGQGCSRLEGEDSEYRR